MDTVGIENFISTRYTEGPKLVASLEEHVRDYEVEIMTEQKAACLQGKEQSGSGLIEIDSYNFV